MSLYKALELTLVSAVLCSHIRHALGCFASLMDSVILGPIIYFGIPLEGVPWRLCFWVLGIEKVSKRLDGCKESLLFFICWGAGGYS